MRIQNQTRGTELASKATAARTFLSRFRGLMLRASLPPGEALVLEPCSSIHTALMRFAIDVVYADRAGHVVKVRPHVKPFRVSAVGRGGYATIELPSGTVEQTGTLPGDQLIFQA